MRRIVTGQLLKRVLAAGSEAAAPSLQASKVLGVETQAATSKQAIFSRPFSQSRQLRSSSAAAERAAQDHPYLVYGAVGALGLGTMYYYWSSQPADASLTPTVIRTDTPGPPAGDRHEIGEFHVLDHMGMHFTQDNLLGNFGVIYFGSADHPGRRKRLLQMAEAVMESDRKSNMHYLIPVFATLTPQEDDVIKLHAMVEDYASALNRKDVLNVRLKAITGDDNKKLHAAAQAYTTQVKAKSGVSSPSAATKEDEGDLYFVSPEGEFIASYGADAAPKDIGTEWGQIMKAYKLSHPTWMGPKAVKERHA